MALKIKAETSPIAREVSFSNREGVKIAFYTHRLKNPSGTQIARRLNNYD
jgi:hypothetical protein